MEVGGRSPQKRADKERFDRLSQQKKKRQAATQEKVICYHTSAGDSAIE
jgi:hypothetical protein